MIFNTPLVTVNAFTPISKCFTNLNILYFLSTLTYLLLYFYSQDA